MSNRASIVSQADVTRTIKACQKAGLAIARVVIRGDRVEIEAGKDSGDLSIMTVAQGKEIVL